MGPQVVALGHEGTPTLAGGDIALAFQIHVGAIHRVVADIQVYSQGPHGGKSVAGNKGPRANKVGDAVLNLYPHRKAGIVVYDERFKGAHGASFS